MRRLKVTEINSGANKESEFCLGDHILECDGESIHSFDRLTSILWKKERNGEVSASITVFRGGEKLSVLVSTTSKLGVSFETIDISMSEHSKSIASTTLFVLGIACLFGSFIAALSFIPTSPSATMFSFIPTLALILTGTFEFAIFYGLSIGLRLLKQITLNTTSMS